MSRLIAFLFLLLAGSASAAIISEQAVPARYLQTTEDADIWAQVGDKVITVGNIRAGQIIGVVPGEEDYYAFRFGFGSGFIDKGHLGTVTGNKRVQDSLGDLNKPLSNQNLITWQDTPLYNAPDKTSPQFGTLAQNLRYPIIDKLKDRLNQTWFQIRIGNRLAWVSSSMRRKIMACRC